jgi:hypothetical protein
MMQSRNEECILPATGEVSAVYPTSTVSMYVCIYLIHSKVPTHQKM